MNRLLAPLRNRIANLVARAVVQLVTDSDGIQTVQLGVLDGETRDGCERLQEYGFSSRPLPGAEAVVLFVGGRRDHGLVVAVDDRRHRPRDLESGEVCLYSDEGDRVTFKRGRIIEVKAGSKVVVDAPTVEVKASTKFIANAPAVELGQPANDGALKGTSYITAQATFLAALSAYAAAIKPIADPTNAATATLASAIATFTAAGNTALSTKVKVG